MMPQILQQDSVLFLDGDDKPKIKEQHKTAGLQVLRLEKRLKKWYNESGKNHFCGELPYRSSV